MLNVVVLALVLKVVKADRHDLLGFDVVVDIVSSQALLSEAVLIREPLDVSPIFLDRDRLLHDGVFKQVLELLHSSMVIVIKGDGRSAKVSKHGLSLTRDLI
jgi:hypothetical protein